MSMVPTFEKYFTSSARETFKGFFDPFGSGEQGPKHYSLGESSWSGRCLHYDDVMNRHSLAKSQILTVAGQLTAGGLWLKPVAGYPRAKDAVKLCEELNRDVRVKTLLYETGIHMAKYGSCFWERTDNPEFSVRLFPNQHLLEPAVVNPVFGVTRWRQVNNNGAEVASFSEDQVIPLHWNVSPSTWPCGTSLLAGLETEFDTLERLEFDIKNYMTKTAFPKEILQVGDKDFQASDVDVATIRQKLRVWKPGDSWATNYPITYIATGVGERKAEGLDTVLPFLKDNLIDGLMVPPISKQYSATEASAKQMMPWAYTNLIRPMQQIIESALIHEVYEPYLMGRGFSVKVVPEVMWVNPDSKLLEEADYYAKLVSTGVMPPRVAADKLGFLDEYLEWEKEQERKKEKELEQQMLAKVNPQPAGGATDKPASVGVKQGFTNKGGSDEQ